MASPIGYLKIYGKTAGGSSLAATLGNLKNMSISNAFRNVGNWFQAVGIGGRDFNGYVLSGGVQATGTFTFSSIADADTLTVAGVTYTAKTSGAALATEFNIGGSDANAAINFAAAVNANANSYTQVIATVTASAVVTISSYEVGLIGNNIGIANSAHAVVSGALLTGGTDGTVFALAKGL